MLSTQSWNFVNSTGPLPSFPGFPEASAASINGGPNATAVADRNGDYYDRGDEGSGQEKGDPGCTGMSKKFQALVIRSDSKKI
jgi:hypothetical protein